ncbi:hypothetical protein AB6809_29695 [Paraburkholderia sp. RCC_158]|uniref:hypothetical protein n=1 Tax=Paraburkholderia sp. RCC_158 TaxID=3239220 RepID=UPI003523730C
MTALKRIVTAAYQTTDGQTFEKKEDAQKHQRELTRLEELKTLVKQALTDATTEPTDLMTAEIAQMIYDHADKLREILPKRAKTAPIKLNEQQSAKFEAGMAQPPLPNEALKGAMDTFKGLSGDVTPALNAQIPVGGVVENAPAFSFPVGLVGNVANQQANANA